MERLNAAMAPAPVRPVKVLQFGEGNFLRAFVDYMIDIANEKSDFNGSVALVKPIQMGTLFPAFKEQDYRYTVMLRGLVDGQAVEQTRVVTSVSDAVDAYADYAHYADYAKAAVAALHRQQHDRSRHRAGRDGRVLPLPAQSYPGKLTKFLFERAEAFDYAQDKGLIILPVELIDDNGIMLKKCVKALAKQWALGEKFEQWLETACVFTSTLVDRIVTGYPRSEDQSIWEKLGYQDNLLDTAEPFGLWVIESPRDLSDELPLPQCGLPVIYTDNQKPYKQRKVRILNGAHTSFVPAAFQCGYDIVLDAMNDPMIATFMQKTLYDEVIPTLSLPKADLTAFAEAVTGRFRNPFIKHALLSICLNSVSKWRARCMPSLLGYVEKTGELPAHLTFSLASLMSLYRGGKLTGDGRLECQRDGQPYYLQDDAAVLNFFAETSSESPEEQAKEFLSNETFFGPDLCKVPGLVESVGASLREILDKGMRTVMNEKFGV